MLKLAVAQASRSICERKEMSSTALQELELGLQEVLALRQHPPRLFGGARSNPAMLRATIAHRRACVVLLCSHYERYLYALNDLVVDYLNQCALPSSDIPIKIRLLQARRPIDEMSRMHWDNREQELISFIAEHASMWNSQANVQSLTASPILESMKSPKVDDVIKFFRLFGIQNIFDRVTTKNTGRSRLTRGLAALVDNRNGIAHGDQTVMPERTELTTYVHVVRDFCTRADKALGKSLERMTNLAPPW
jgi:RiboL-PSP-HEPN